MRYRVIATFRDLKSDLYVQAGAKCPQLDAETAARLVAAGCIVAEAAPESPAAPPPESPAGAAPGDGPTAARRGARKGRAAPE